MSATEKARTYPVVTFREFPEVRTLGELRVAIIDLEHMAPWFDVGSCDAGAAVRHAVGVLAIVSGFCFQERRPKAERWTRTRPAHLIAAPARAPKLDPINYLIAAEFLRQGNDLRRARADELEQLGNLNEAAESRDVADRVQGVVQFLLEQA